MGAGMLGKVMAFESTGEVISVRSWPTLIGTGMVNAPAWANCSVVLAELVADGRWLTDRATVVGPVGAGARPDVVTGPFGSP